MNLQGFADRVSEIVWGGERAWIEHDGLERLANQVLVIKEQAAQQQRLADGAWWCKYPCNRLHGEEQDKCVVCGSPRQ